jgi:hypothetical protein
MIVYLGGPGMIHGSIAYQNLSRKEEIKDSTSVLFRIKIEAALTLALTR